VLTIIDRECVDPDGYSLEPFSDFKIPQGMPVWIPIFAIARDEKYFPDPLKFDPSRFENAENLPPCSFLLSFGVGPKQCIAERFSMILIKSVVVNVLKEFKIEANEKTPKEIKFKKEAYVIESEERMVVDFVRDAMVFS
jgi:cytochrome P450 family 6